MSPTSKRILLTGATGFFGKSMFRHLPELQNYDLTILSRNPSFPLDLQGDVRTFKFPDGEFDYIFHGATTSSTIVSDYETQSVIIEGTKHILEFAKNQPAKFLYISSGAVYGIEYSPVDETHACNPTTVYGKAKLEAEGMVRETLKDWCIARCFAFIGEDLPLNAHFAIGNFINNCIKNESIVVRGDGSPIRTYMYTKDLSNWLYLLLLEGSGIYNVGSSRRISILELAELVRKINGETNEIVTRNPSFPLDEKPICYAPVIDKASEFGLRETVSLEEAIKMTIEHHRRVE